MSWHGYDDWRTGGVDPGGERYAECCADCGDTRAWVAYDEATLRGLRGLLLCEPCACERGWVEPLDQQWEAAE